MKHNLLKLACLYLLLISSYASACSCGPSPLLSTYSIHSNIVSAHVIRYFQNEDEIYHAMELQISQVFNGILEKNTIVVKGGNGLSCSAGVESFPIGSEWVFNLSITGDGDEAGLGGCYNELEVVDGEIDGYIRDTSCNGDYYSPQCALNKEKMSIEHFDLIQSSYFSGARDAIGACTKNRLKDCPRTKAHFFVEENKLSVPYVGIYKHQRDLNRDPPKTPIAEVSVTLELLEGADGSLLFDLDYIRPF